MERLDQLGAIVDRDLRRTDDERGDVLVVLRKCLAVNRMDFNAVVVDQRCGDIVLR